MDPNVAQNCWGQSRKPVGSSKKQKADQKQHLSCQTYLPARKSKQWQSESAHLLNTSCYSESASRSIQTLGCIVDKKPIWRIICSANEAKWKKKKQLMCWNRKEKAGGKIFMAVTRYKQANNLLLTRWVIMAFCQCVSAAQSMVVI